MVVRHGAWHVPGQLLILVCIHQGRPCVGQAAGGWRGARQERLLPLQRE
jgi:hypothetical protein